MYEHNRPLRCTASELVMGNEYLFKVFSENLCGLSEKPGLSCNSAVIPKAGNLKFGGFWMFLGCFWVVLAVFGCF